MINRTRTALAVVLALIFICPAIGNCTQNLKITNTTAIKTQNPPSYSYPDIPRYYPNPEVKDRIELLTEAVNDQEIVAWADKNHLPRIVKPTLSGSTFLVFTQYSGKHIMLNYNYNYVPTVKNGNVVRMPDMTSQKPLKLQFVGLFDGVDENDGLSQMYNYYMSNFGCKTTPKTTKLNQKLKIEPMRGFKYNYPNSPKHTDWTMYKDYINQEALPKAKSRLEIVETVSKYDEASYWQLVEPFNRLFFVLEPIGSGITHYQTYIYGDIGKGSEPWVLLCVVDLIQPESEGGFDGKYIYLDKKTRNLIFSGRKDGISGYINVENELKLIYGDQYKAIMGDAKSK